MENFAEVFNKNKECMKVVNKAIELLKEDKDIDTFFNRETNVTRLYNEWVEHDGIVVAFDFDNTVYDYHNKGYIYKNTVKILKACKEAGCTLVLYSCNNDESKIEFMKKYLDEIDLTPDYINKTPDTIPFGHEGSKIYFNILLDDRAGLYEAYSILKETYIRVMIYKLYKELIF